MADCKHYKTDYLLVHQISMSCLFGILVVGSLFTQAHASIGFQPLGDLSGGAFDSSASFVSPDGMIVLGESETGSGDVPFIWTEAGGMVELSLFPSGEFTSGLPAAITNNASVISGSGSSTSGQEAYRWTETSGAIGLSDIPGGIFNSSVAAMSNDGSVIVGSGTYGSDAFNNSEAFIWTVSDGLVGLGDLPTGGDQSQAVDVSADGSVVVGWGLVDTAPPEALWESLAFRAFRWTEAGGMVDLGSPAPGLNSRARAVSPDGSVVVGDITDDLGNWSLFRWTEDTGLLNLGDMPSGLGFLYPNAVAGNGFIVGQGVTDYSGESRMEAFIWDQSNGIRILQDVLIDLGLDLTGWTLTEATGISDDGLTIVGTGINPNGDTEAFIATLPEPGTLGLLVVGAAVMGVRRWRAG